MARARRRVVVVVAATAVAVAAVVLGLVLTGSGTRAAAAVSPPPVKAAVAPSAPPFTPFDAGVVSAGSWHFTGSSLDPAAFTVRTRGSLPPGFVFTAPVGATVFYGHMGPLISAADGQPVWVYPLPAGQMATGFQTATYQGKPVLTWWQGTISNGYGKGYGVIMSSSYRIVATVHAGNGYQADLHEFQVTPQGDAWLTAYRVVPADLASIGGPVKGELLDSVVQEIDVATGKVLFQWDPFAHIPLDQSYSSYKAGQPYDAYHVNAVEPGTHGDLLISSRATSTVYDVSLASGQILWRLGGKSSTFRLGPGASFSWQHDARFAGPDLVTVFDNAMSTKVAGLRSSALELRLDLADRSATLVRRYSLGDVQSPSQGSVELLPGGGAFVGWGSAPWVSAYAGDGQLVYSASLRAPDESYRAFLLPWTGRPTTPPSLTVSPLSSKVSAAYASWNGATQVTRWRVLEGSSPDKLTARAVVARQGFTTGITLPRGKGDVAVQALDSAGHVLGTSATVGF